MIADRSDLGATLAKKHSQQQQAMLPMARLLAGAAPVMDKLARTPEWERYCTYLQGVSEQYAARKKVALERLGDPSVIEDKEVRKLRQDIFIANVTVDTLQFAIELPAAIVKGGEEAQQFVNDFEAKNENSKST